MNKHELVNTLKQAKTGDATSAALDFLGSSARRWWDHRQKAGQKRIVNEETMEMVSEFKANGQTYYILQPQDGINVYRMSKLKQMLSIAYTDQNFSEQMQFNDKLTKLANTLVTKSPRLDLLFAALKEDRERLQATRERKWDYSLMACTFFIVKPDEDLSKWTQQDADKKIDDWSAEGIHEEDFFLCAILWGSLLTQRRKSFLEKLQEKTERLKEQLEQSTSSMMSAKS
jgi:hypothetical protein